MERAVVRNSRLSLAVDALRSVLGDVAVEPADELCGFDALIPLRVRSGARPGLYPLMVSSDGRATLDRPLRHDRLPGGPACAPGALATFEQLLVARTSDVARFETGTPRSITWLEGDFYRIDGPDATTLLYAQWLADGSLRGLIAGYGFGEPERVHARRFAELAALPVGCSFRIVWGGRSLRDNRHYYHRSQRYGVDLEPDGAAETVTVLAPVAGTVIDARGDVHDNRAYSPVPAGVSAFGNYVTIRSGDVDVVLCHLAYDSVAVRAGTAVAPGTQIGRMGNSGNSSIPHLHCHAQTVHEPAHGVPLRFPSPNGSVEPVRGARWPSLGLRESA